MALQLKNKAKEEKTESEKNKKGKYKRKRNVFGKRLTRFGLIGLIAGLIVAFVIVKVVFTLNQNSKQKKIDKKLTEVKQVIEETRRKLAQKQKNYANVGKLISTLPTTYDRQALSIDLNRMVVLSGLEESKYSDRKITELDKCPIECSINTIKAVQIDMYLTGELDNPTKVLNFIDFLTEYTHENFYYIETIDYKEDRYVSHQTETKITMYTFYNDVTLSTPTENTDNTTTTTITA